MVKYDFLIAGRARNKQNILKICDIFDKYNIKYYCFLKNEDNWGYGNKNQTTEEKQKEFERLKQLENQNREWDIKRILTKNNYLIYTDAIKNYILPDSNYYKNKEWLKYAEEADILNVALFNTTTKEWRKQIQFQLKLLI